MNYNYMYDDYHAEGSSMESFKEECRILDENTIVKQIDFAPAKIFSFDKRTAKSVLYYKIIPGLTRFNVPIIPDVREMNEILIKMKNTGVLKLISENIREESSKTFFAIETDETTGQEAYLFPGRQVMAKTFTSAMPCKHSEFSHERNLLLAHNLAETDTYNVTTVLRKAGDFYKIVRFYNNDDTNYTYSHRSFSDIVKAVEAEKGGRCIKWNATQGCVELYYEFYKDVKEIKNKYPDTEYLPCYVFRLCDSGYINSGLSLIWRKESDTECSQALEGGSPFAFHFRNANTFTSLIEIARKHMDETADHFCNGAKKSVIEASDRYTMAMNINGVLKDTEMDKLVGKKCRKSILDDIFSHGVTSFTYRDLVDYISDRVSNVTSASSANEQQKSANARKYMSKLSDSLLSESPILLYDDVLDKLFDSDEKVFSASDNPDLISLVNAYCLITGMDSDEELVNAYCLITDMDSDEEFDGASYELRKAFLQRISDYAQDSNKISCRNVMNMLEETMNKLGFTGIRNYTAKFAEALFSENITVKPIEDELVQYIATCVKSEETEEPVAEKNYA